MNTSEYPFGISFHPNRKSVNYYELLGVKSDATSEEIKNAFFDKSKKVELLIY